MSGQPDSSDDLIAELAKLMATNAKGEAAMSGQGAAKSAAPSEAKPVVRIPGMDMPPLTVTPIGASQPGAPKPPLTLKPRPSGAPPLRIPGMESPPAAAPARAEPKLDGADGKAASPAPGSRPVLPGQASLGPVPVPQVPQGTSERPAATARFEPRIVGDSKPQAPAAPEPSAPRPLTATPSPAVAPPLSAAPQPMTAAPKAQPAAPERKTSDAGAQAGGDSAGDHGDHPPADDPIAQIIAAESGPARPPAEEAAPDSDLPSGPVPVPTAAARPQATAPRPLQVAPPAGRKPASVTPLPVKQPGLGVKQVPPESDAFFVAPALGVTGKSEVPPPAAESTPVAPAAPRRPDDPLDEIENLIGEAVRVDLGEQGAAKRARPNVNPVAPQLQPRRATIKQHDPDSQPHSAEAAILAAAAATGAEVGRVEPTIAEEPAFRRKQFRPVRAKSAPSGMRQYVGFAVAGTLLLAAGFGLYWVLGMGRPAPGDAPVLTADATPVKQAPLVSQANLEPSSPVLDQIDGVSTPPEQEALVTPTTSDTEALVTATAAEPESEAVLANRKVRTVTVRPDGTIVASDDSVAGAEPLPVDRPDVPEVPGASVEPSELLAAAVEDATPPPAAAPPVTDVAAVEATPRDAIASVIAGSSEAGGGEQVATISPAPLALAPGAVPTPANVLAPVPQPRPTNRASLTGQPSRSVTAEVTEPRPTLDTALTANGQPIDLLAQPDPVSTPAPQATQTASRGGAAAYVQLSSQRSEADARASAQSMRSRFGSIFGNAQLEIQRADLGARGIYYRVMLPASSRSQAADVCARVKSSGGDCFVP